jgi:hypothetical protein
LEPRSERQCALDLGCAHAGVVEGGSDVEPFGLIEATDDDGIEAGVVDEAYCCVEGVAIVAGDWNADLLATSFRAPFRERLVRPLPRGGR